MEQNKEQDVSSAPIPFRNHTALLLCAALPYLHPAYRHPLELALKFLEFTETLRLFQEFHGPGGSAPFFQRNSPSVESTGVFGLINRYITDLEGLLRSLSSVCTGDEKELINTFLNLVHVKNFYDTYGDLLNSQFTDTSGLASLLSGVGNAGAPFAEQQTSAQKETLELLKSLFSDE